MKKQMLCVSLIAAALLAMLMGPSVASAGPQKHIRAMMDVANAHLEAMGEPIGVGAVEYYTAGEEVGQIVYYNDRTKQYGIRWVPGDPGRHDGTEITWTSNLLDGTATGLTHAETQAELCSAMATWGNANCAEIPLVMQLYPGVDWGLYQWVAGYVNSPLPFVPIDWGIDIAHAGWLPGAFFDWLYGPGASDSVIGVAITFYWLEYPGGPPSDIDNNGKFDTAFVEIYYNNAFPWGVGTDWPLDVRTVVLHEAGHALSIDHFGRIFRTAANGKVHFAPLAIMNAGYSRKLWRLKGTDLASYCSVWAAWPKK